MGRQCMKNNETVTVQKEFYGRGETVVVEFENNDPFPKDWVGLYQFVDEPGVDYSYKWTYTHNKYSGTIFFPGVAPGHYYAVLLENDGYNILAESDDFIVSSYTYNTISMTKTFFREHQTVSVEFTITKHVPKDWIGIYRTGQTPGQVYSTQWAYTNKSAGTLDFKNLDIGTYFAALFENDGYKILARTSFDVYQSGSNGR